MTKFPLDRPCRISLKKKTQPGPVKMSLAVALVRKREIEQESSLSCFDICHMTKSHMIKIVSNNGTPIHSERQECQPDFFSKNSQCNISYTVVMGTVSTNILHAASCVQHCAYKLQIVTVIKWFVI